MEVNRRGHRPNLREINSLKKLIEHEKKYLKMNITAKRRIIHLLSTEIRRSTLNVMQLQERIQLIQNDNSTNHN